MNEDQVPNLRSIRIKNETEGPTHFDDCQRIVLVFMKHGFFILPGQAEKLWRAYSRDSANAVWVSLPEEDEDLFRRLDGYYEPLDDPAWLRGFAGV